MKIDYSKPLVDLKKCAKCIYAAGGNTNIYCGYLNITGHSRTSLHPEGLTSDCKEFMPRKRGRPKKEVT